MDTACGFAALTLAPSDAGVLTVEYKVNFMSPGSGERMTAHGRVLKRGRAVTVCAGDACARQAKHERHIATIANVTDRPNIVG